LCFFFCKKKPDAAIRDVKKFAEKKGYRWQENPDNPELAYDLMVFKTGYAFLLKVRAVSHPPGRVFKKNCRKTISVKSVSSCSRNGCSCEIWFRTRHEHTFSEAPDL